MVIDVQSGVMAVFDPGVSLLESIALLLPSPSRSNSKSLLRPVDHCALYKVACCYYR